MKLQKRKPIVTPPAEMRCNQSDGDIHLDFENYIFAFGWASHHFTIKCQKLFRVNIQFRLNLLNAKSEHTLNETVFDALTSISRLHNNIELTHQIMIFRAPQFLFIRRHRANEIRRNFFLFSPHGRWRCRRCCHSEYTPTFRYVTAPHSLAAFSRMYVYRHDVMTCAHVNCQTQPFIVVQSTSRYAIRRCRS